MIHFRAENNIWTLTLGGRTFSLHRPGHPFATAVKREKTYTADRGSVRTVVTETERIPLETLSLENDRLVFSAGEHRLGLSLSGEDPLCTAALFGEDGWAYEFAFPAGEEAAVFGGGEQYRKVNLMGETVVNFVSEHIKASTVAEKAFLPKRAYREKEHKDIGSYAPMPVFVTDESLMILFSTSADGTSRFEKNGSLFSFDRCPESFSLIQGRSFRDLAMRLTALYPNRQYLPDWCQDGMILGVQGGTETVLKKAFAMLDAGARISAVWCQDWSGENSTVMGKQVWWNWEADELLYPKLKDAIRQLRKRGVRFLAYINPYLVKGSRLYKLCEKKNYLIRHRDGSVYHIKSTTFEAGMLDLTDPEAVRYIKEELIRKNMLDWGISGWMADFGEYLPTDCVLHDGDPALLHNEWPLIWARINREAIEEFGCGDEFFFSRAGYLGIQQYAPILWNGDQHTDYTHDYGMPCVMPASFSLGFSGVSLVHSDIGGFFSFGKLRRDAELFTRWMEMSTFSVLMRSHESLRPWANAQFDDPAVLPHTVRLTRLHSALKPYITELLKEAQAGIPAMRPDFWEAGHFSAGRDPYSYFLGDDLYICPVIAAGQKTRRVHLPAGDWTGFWDGASYTGGSFLTLPAPLGQPPVFYRSDSRYAALFRRAADQK